MEEGNVSCIHNASNSKCLNTCMAGIIIIIYNNINNVAINVISGNHTYRCKLVFTATHANIVQVSINE